MRAVLRDACKRFVMWFAILGVFIFSKSRSAAFRIFEASIVPPRAKRAEGTMLASKMLTQLALKHSWRLLRPQLVGKCSKIQNMTTSTC